MLALDLETAGKRRRHEFPFDAREVCIELRTQAKPGAFGLQVQQPEFD